MAVSNADLAAFPLVQRKAIVFLQGIIASRQPADDRRLPSVKQLAAAAGVSFKTMWKAVDALRKGGLIECQPGQGIFLVADESASVPLAGAGEPLPRGIWRKLSSRMATDILCGVFEAGSVLPSGKELQRRYGVSFATLKKCLAHLHRDGLITPHGSSFMIKPFHTSRTSVSVVLVHGIDWMWQVKSIRFWQEGFLEIFMRCIEERCSRSSIALQVAFRTVEDGVCKYFDGVTNRPFDFARASDAMGYISEMNMPMQGGLQEQELSMLASLKKPVAAFNPGDAFRLPADLAENRLIRIYRTSSDRECGSDLAHLLLTMGHRRIAYLSPYHGFEWSHRRLEGLTATYAAAGNAGGVIPLTLDEYSRRTSFFESVPPDHKPASWMQAYRNWAQTVSPEYGAVLDPVMSYASYDGLVRAEIYRVLKPLFARALADASITAWVCANDATSVLALDFLGKNGRSIPGNISLIGCDDSFEALNSRLASYNFDMPALAHSMLQFVMQHRQVARFQRARVVRIPGYIVLRGSIAPVVQ